MKFLNALGFLTIIKIPKRFYIDQSDYPRMLVYFPLVGLIIGILSSALFFSLNFILPIILTAIIVVGFEIIITGGIHMDGLADTFDGAFSGKKDKNKIIEIMKKPGVGVFGILAVVITIIFKIILFYLIAVNLGIVGLIDLDHSFLNDGSVINNIHAILPGLLVFFTIAVFSFVYGRLSMIYLFSKYGAKGKTNSLTDAFKHKNNKDVFILSYVYLSIVFIALSVITRMGYTGSIFNLELEISAVFYALLGVAIGALTLLFAAWIAKYFVKKVGSLRGDIIGAVCVITEILFLFLNYISILIK